MNDDRNRSERDLNVTHRVVLLVGSPLPLGELLVKQNASVRVWQAKDCRQAVDDLERESPSPELILLVDDSGGSFDETQIESLRKRAPLARIWRVVGPWGEGEARSGRPLAGCQTFYWHEWAARWERELAAIEAGQPPSWSCPETATSEERLLATPLLNSAPRNRATQSGMPGARLGTIAICAPQASAARTLADLCQMAGYKTSIVSEPGSQSVPQAVALLWDVEPEGLADAARLARLRKRVGQAPVLAITGFPRPHDIAIGQTESPLLNSDAPAPNSDAPPIEAGLAGVIAKPYRVDDLLWQLDQAIVRHGSK